MPVAVSYPGIYIEEVPSQVRTITPVGTSVTAFVGYSHPFQTAAADFNRPVQIFNFSDYVRTFGGFFGSATLPNYLPYAVQQFFQNDGAEAWIVGLPSTGANAATVNVPNHTGAVTAVVFNAIEVTETAPIVIRIKHSTSGSEPFDVEVSFRGATEIYRGLKFSSATDPDYILTRINNAPSLLVRAAAPSSGTVALPREAGYPAGSPLPVIQLTGGTAGSPATTLVSDFANEAPPRGIFALEQILFFNLLVLPGISDVTTLARALAYAEKRRAFLIADSAPPVQDWLQVQTQFGLVPKERNGAFYFPWLRAVDPLDGVERSFPPSAYVAGIYARTDTQRGVWKAPAGIEARVSGIVGLEPSAVMTDERQGVLNKLGINVIRNFPIYDTIVWGSRTLLGADGLASEWKYVPVRRTALFIEETLYQNLKWVVFEPNAEPLWAAIRMNVTAFMMSLFRQAAFFGEKPSEAFLVKCDAETNPESEINLGRVNILVGFRPLKPAEFVIIKISLLAGQTQT